MDQADAELRATICKVRKYIGYTHILRKALSIKLLQVWPYEGKDKVDLLVPPQEGIYICRKVGKSLIVGRKQDFNQMNH